MSFLWESGSGSTRLKDVEGGKLARNYCSGMDSGSRSLAWMEGGGSRRECAKLEEKEREKDW